MSHKSSRRGSKTARRRVRPQPAARRGSSLLVVMVLLAMLASLGVIFYVFASQERTSSAFYSDAAKVTEYDVTADTLMDYALEQLIVGPGPKQKNSALYGRRHTLMGNTLGVDSTGKKFDFAPYNGLARVPTAGNYWTLNDSPGANNRQDPQPLTLAHQDPDYTYPDANNLFLSYQGYDPVNGQLIVIPSFHRPQSPALRGTPTGWYNPGNGQLVLRPNSNHLYVPRTGQSLDPAVNPPVSRYLNQAAAQGLWGTQVTGFPVQPPRDPNPALGPATRTSRFQGVWSLSTAWTSGTGIAYENDVDNDGDGVWEGVWLDLDFPVQETATGENYVPFFSFTIKDADALLNLNVHGNLAQVWTGDMEMSAATTPFVGTVPANGPMVSQSNQGLSPGEINPAWGFTRRPQSAAHVSAGSNRHDGAYTADTFFGGVPISWQESANRDLLYLLMGRYTASPSDLVPGRWGEENLLYQAIANSSTRYPLFYSFASPGSTLANPWPGPGQTLVDDNGNLQQVSGGWYGSTFTPFGHPLDYTGVGRYYSGKTLLNPGTFSRARWPRYTRYSNVSTATQAVSWPTLTNSINDYGLFNDVAELVSDGDDPRPEDATFGADEMRALHLSPTDFANATGGQTRLTSLAPYNMDTSITFGVSQPRFTQEFRGKFTTRSWDRKQFSLAFDATNRPWEFFADADGDVNLGVSTSAGREFPPRLGGAPYTATDSFRPLLRRLIEVEVENFSQPRYGLRLNLNQLLVGPNGNPFPTFQSVAQGGMMPPNLQLSYRPLTPHPDPVQTALSANPITNFGTTSYPANGNFNGNYPLQEYWARVDRQLLARDLFVMLYTVAWPAGINPTGNAGSGGTALTLTDANTQNAIRQMAQFAVNTVDSLDRDNIITRFEYDENPTDGWDSDDNPYTTADADRREVFGVERLDLTLSEALAVRAEPDTSNIPFTQWDDTNAQHFCYVELRNPGPFVANLTTRSWRVEVGPDYTDTANTDLAQFRRLVLRQGTVAAGQLFTIGSAETSVGGTSPSVMKVSPSGTAPSNWDTDTASWIAPPALRPLNLDLKDAAHNARYNLEDAAGNAVPTGALYDGAMYGTLAASSVPYSAYVRLYRRVNPTRPEPTTALQENDNPFVLVDEIFLNELDQNTSTNRGGNLDLDATDMATDINTKLANLQSREHAEPFSADMAKGYAWSNNAAPYANTLAASNSYSPTLFRNWQRVFDRDFASPGELLQLTLGGFSETERIRSAGTSRAPVPGAITGFNATNPYAVLETGTTIQDTQNGTAEMLFLPFSAFENSTGSGAANGKIHVSAATTMPPQWARFLEFVEVPTRMHAGIPGFADPFDYARAPGKMNLNTLRHPEALAGLLDDPSIMELVVDEDRNFNGMLDTTPVNEDLDGDSQVDLFNPPVLLRTDLTGGTGETLFSWWQGLIAARDGSRSSAAPYTVTPDSTTGLYLPGTAGSAPFRSFASMPTTYSGVESTLLRSWPGDPVPTSQANITTAATFRSPRQLFELGTGNEHNGEDSATPVNPVPPVDPYIRRRILNKLMNNVTPRSNVFVVFVSVKYFRANVETSGAVRIGGPLKAFTDTTGLPANPPDRTDAGWEPEHRGFFIIDRTQLEKAYDRGTGEIDFRPLIEFRQILQ